MQLIERSVKSVEKFRKDIKAFGVNSNGIFSIIFNDDSILNLRKEEALALKNFLQQCYSREVDGTYGIGSNSEREPAANTTHSCVQYQ